MKLNDFIVYVKKRDKKMIVFIQSFRFRFFIFYFDNGIRERFQFFFYIQFRDVQVIKYEFVFVEVDFVDSIFVVVFIDGGGDSFFYREAGFEFDIVEVGVDVDLQIVRFNVRQLLFLVINEKDNYNRMGFVYRLYYYFNIVSFW